MVAKTLKTMGTRFKVQGTPWEPLFMPYHGDEVISLDCATTGLDPHTDDLLTVAAVKIRDGKIMTSEKLDLRLPPVTETSSGLDSESMAFARSILKTAFRFRGASKATQFHRK